MNITIHTKLLKIFPLKIRGLMNIIGFYWNLRWRRCIGNEISILLTDNLVFPVLGLTFAEKLYTITRD